MTGSQRVPLTPLAPGSRFNVPISGSTISSPRHCRALIADDDGPWRFILRSVLEGAGIDVIGEAHDAEGAVDLARRRQPDLVLLDLHMPSLGGGGLGALLVIREELPATRIIVCSVDEQQRTTVLASGAEWVAKQDGVAALRAAIQHGPQPPPPDRTGAVGAPR
jgi:DNA-binding NarL/FixJ family response regulator